MDVSTELLLVAQFAMAGLLLIDGFRRPNGYLELPFLTAAIFALWYLPQAVALGFDDSLPSGSLNRVLVMSLLCFALSTLGWRAGVKGATSSTKPVHMNLPATRLIWPVGILTAFAAGMQVLILGQPAEAITMGAWSGPITIMAFLATVNVVSLVMSIAMVLRQITPSTVALAAINAVLYAPSVLLYFRRSETFEFTFAVLLPIYFILGKQVPRLAIAAGLFLGFFFVNGAGYLRAASGGLQLNWQGSLETRSLSIAEISEIDWAAAVAQDDDLERSETRNAAIYIEAVERSHEHSFGAEIYNRIIQNYIPGQIIGFDVKRDLQIGISLEELALQQLQYVSHTGTTSTGFAHPYRDFWYFGSIIFFAFSYWMGVMYRRAKAGNLVSFVIYASTISLSIHSITHYGYYYVLNSQLPLLAIWLVTRVLSRTERGFIANSTRSKSVYSFD